MLDFAEFVAINKFDRKGARRRAARRAQAGAAQPRGLRQAARRDAGVRHDGRRFNDDGVTALYQALAAAAGRARACSSATGTLPPVDDAPQHAPDADRAGGARALPRRDRRHACAATSSARCAQARAGARDASSCARAARMLHDGQARQGATPPRPSIDLAGEREARLDARRRASCSPMWPDMQQRLRRRRVRREDPRQGDPHRADHTTLSGTKIRKVALPQYEDHGEILQVAAARERAGLASRTPPAPSRSSARTRTRRACSPAKATRSAPTRASSCCSAGMPAKRLSTAFDSVTLYGNDPRPAARHLRQGRQLGRVDRHARRHEGAVLAASTCASPSTSVSMTINGPAPTILAMFMNTAIDQQLDKFRAENGREPDRRRGREDPRLGAGRTCAARCRPTS